ncbi:ABC transporter, permease protein [Aeropyrum pernix K1]|uniref:ABC transporter, permease protein n=1 Tax=Aeropyrum pernix (strain ATCC 700893 / DSM 11879 / JCM 9820 / NBRC 100138 / K1) TaxID=272557 RepID=Q9Y8X0_AERPE|nr:ABC transporter permease [Aeropyrum pernix]BAA81530.1 ABC transporter, permease protein [Aeropyrum pernix K1]
MSIIYHVRVAKAVALRDFKIRITYIPWIINSLIQPIIWTYILIYTYRAVLGETAQTLQKHGWPADYVGFLILGQVLLSLFNALNWRAGMAIQRERWFGTLEIVFLTPASRLVMLTGSSIYGLLDAGWVSFSAALIVFLATGTGFNIADPLAALLSVSMAVVGAVSMGIGLAGLYVLTRSAGPIAIAIQHPLRFFSGSSFPLSILPASLQYIGYALPLTYGIEAARISLLEGAPIDEVSPLILRLALISLVGIIAGILFVRWAESLAKKYGWLHTF